MVCLAYHFYESIRVQHHDDSNAHHRQWLGNLRFVCSSSSWPWIVSLEINPRKSLPVPMKRSVQSDRSFLYLQDIYDQHSLHDFAPMAQRFLLFCKIIVMEIVLSPSVEGALKPASINGNRKHAHGGILRCTSPCDSHLRPHHIPQSPSSRPTTHTPTPSITSTSSAIPRDLRETWTT